MTGTQLDRDTSRETAGKTWYVTTSIPYVNAPPHVGFAMELIQADVIARHRRAQGYDVRFQAGTDENSLKNVQAAVEAGVATETLVAENASRFRELGPALNLSIDDFIRTSADPRHRAAVERLWQACAEAGAIYKKFYEGLYCVGCEQFYRPAELEAGLCPEHGTRPETVSEENYFFRLSRYRDDVRESLASGRLVVEPATRRREVLRWVEDGLQDFSISRSAARSRGWGIPVPGDAEQVIYVWFDALGNYISALDYATGGADFHRFWLGDGAREHVIGKGISRFHAVYWPAILLAAGLPLPTRVLVHGYVTIGGRKIGKSAGNAIDPLPLARDLGADALRYFLLRHIRSTEDGDFTHERFIAAYRSDLADQLGNLAHRTFTMVDRYLGGTVSPPPQAADAPSPLALAARRLPEAVERHIAGFEFHAALAEIWSLIALANKFVADARPWSLAAQAAAKDGSEASRHAALELRRCLTDLVHTLKIIGRCLGPFLPETSEKLLQQCRRTEGPGETGPAAGRQGRRASSDAVLFPKEGAGGPQFVVITDRRHRPQNQSPPRGGPMVSGDVEGNPGLSRPRPPSSGSGASTCAPRDRAGPWGSPSKTNPGPPSSPASGAPPPKS